MSDPPNVSRLIMVTANRSHARQAFVALFCVAMLGYFTVYAVSGRHGLEHRRALVERLTAADGQAARLEAQRARLENDVARLSGPTPDPDLLSEFALRELGMLPAGARLVRQMP